MCHTMQILHVVEIRLLGRAQCPRQGTLAVAVPAADRAHTPPSEGTGGPKGRAHPHLGVPSGPLSRYLFRGNTSAVSKSSKIDRPRRPAAQSAHRATAAPMLRAYVDRGLGAVPARYR